MSFSKKIIGLIFTFIIATLFSCLTQKQNNSSYTLNEQAILAKQRGKYRKAFKLNRKALKRHKDIRFLALQDSLAYILNKKSRILIAENINSINPIHQIAVLTDASLKYAKLNQYRKCYECLDNAKEVV